MKIIEKLIKDIGGGYSQDLGIDLESLDPTHLFKWFLASLLFGARISEGIAIRTFQEFQREDLDSAQKILKRGWDGLVEVLDRGGYVRYDFKTATKLLEVCGNLLGRYGGDLNLLHQRSKDARDLEGRLKQLGKGIGEVTVNIFLRELRGIWERANPPLQEFSLQAALNLGLVSSPQGALDQLKAYGDRQLEPALLRLGKNFCHKGRCNQCPMGVICPKRGQ